ncbi:hypothetical protein SAMN04487936_11350 [Halobacillus dabanensis]|uniref:Uncharacterized protein n=1 Tax=Halobacillus dabanensis TaxID=240302 RepID=A0A1I3Z9Y0_HALDA|nr:hypothetical protein SAMN04487936_11350 [Halobacillus dabanensis]
MSSFPRERGESPQADALRGLTKHSLPAGLPIPLCPLPYELLEIALQYPAINGKRIGLPACDYSISPTFSSLYMKVVSTIILPYGGLENGEPPVG